MKLTKVMHVIISKFDDVLLCAISTEISFQNDKEENITIFVVIIYNRLQQIITFFY